VVYSSPAVVGGVVYVGSGDGKVYALKASSGAKLWSYTTGTSGGGVRSSPAVVGGVVYVGSGDGKVYALKASSGAKLWSYTTSNWVYSSPAVVNGVVYVGSQDGNVYALGASSTLSPSQSPIVPEFFGQMLGIALAVSMIIVLSAVIAAKKRKIEKIQRS
jgi:outer membrane protein assembly factor BamB